MSNWPRGTVFHGGQAAIFFGKYTTIMRVSVPTSRSVICQVDQPNGSMGHHRGFSLVELVIVVVIIGVLSAVAVPRISSAAKGAKAEALLATLTNVRKAIDVYYAEHGKYPGYTPGTTTPNNTIFINQLMDYSSETGATNGVGNSTFLYGPYLRPPFPENPFNHLSTVVVKANASVADPVKESVGWVAVLSDGAFYISAATTTLNDVGIIKASRVNALIK